MSVGIRARAAMVVVACLGATATARGQEPYLPLAAAAAGEPALRRSVSVDVRGEALGTALRLVAKQAAVDFVLDGALPELSAPVSLNLQHTALPDVLVALIASAGAADRVELVVARPATIIVRGVTRARSAAPAREISSGVIAGVIHDAVTGSPVAGAEVGVDAEQWLTRTDPRGRFAVADVSPGAHTVVVRRLGFSPLRIPGVAIGSEGRRDMTVLLRPAPLELDAVAVTTATYSAFSDPARRPSVTREQLDRIPHFGDDAFRAVAGLPGVSTDDFSAKLHVRGGAGDDLRILLDGVELIDPYHLRSVGGMFSLVDAHAVGGMTLTAGDVGAEYGNLLSGVLSIQSLQPDSDRPRGEIVADVHHVSVAAHGASQRTGASWLVTARYGYPDVILRRAHVTGAITSRFGDVFARTNLARGAHNLSVSALVAADRLQRSTDERSRIDDDAAHGYVWATARSGVGPHTSVRTTASLGRVRASRDGVGVASTSLPVVRYLPLIGVDDRQHTRVAALRQDWAGRIGEAWLATWGGEVTRIIATDRYALDSIRSVSSVPSDTPSRWRLRRQSSVQTTSGGAYTSHRLRLTSRAVADIGLRYDQQDATRERVWSPRIHASYALFPRTVVRAGWGRYAQSERPFDLDVAQADTVLQRGDRAEHRAFGIEHETTSGVMARVELYDRVQSRVRPRFYRAPSSAALFPELSAGRLLVAPDWRRARGAEVALSSWHGGALGWRAAYGYAVARESIAGTVTRGAFDDRHTARLEASYAHRRQWRAGAAWVYRSGWAATERIVDVRVEQDVARTGTLLGPYNERDHGRYSRLDVRLERSWTGRRGTFSISGDVYNALDQANTHSFERVDFSAVTAIDGQTPGSIEHVSESSTVPMLSPLLTLGARWRW